TNLHSFALPIVPAPRNKIISDLETVSCRRRDDPSNCCYPSGGSVSLRRNQVDGSLVDEAVSRNMKRAGCMVGRYSPEPPALKADLMRVVREAGIRVAEDLVSGPRSIAMKYNSGIAATGDG